jgi:hypothetical protein
MIKKKKIGRPEKELDWKLLDSILQYGAKCVDCADICEVSEDTIQRKIRQDFGMTFMEYREKKMSKTRIKLLQKQVSMALDGCVPLLIWLGKNMLGQSDKTESIDLSEEKEIKITINKVTSGKVD